MWGVDYARNYSYRGIKAINIAFHLSRYIKNEFTRIWVLKSLTIHNIFVYVQIQSTRHRSTEYTFSLYYFMILPPYVGCIIICGILLFLLLSLLDSNISFEIFDGGAIYLNNKGKSKLDMGDETKLYPDDILIFWIL